MSNKYQREIKPGVFVDVYDVLQAWRVTNPALQHLIKKALAPGERGHKTCAEDLRDIEASARRAVELQAYRIEIDMPVMDEGAWEPAHTCWLPLNPNAKASELPIEVMEARLDTIYSWSIRVPCDAGGWVEWLNGPRPVPGEAFVDLMFRDGDFIASEAAGAFLWNLPDAGPECDDITHFRLAKQEQPE